MPLLQKIINFTIMTKEEILSIRQKVRERIEHSKKYGTDFTIPGDPWANDSLAKVINTKEKAEIFTLLLEREMNKANK